MTLHVRVTGPSSAILPRVREEVQKTDRSLPMSEVRTLALEMQAALVQERLIAILSTAFGALALLWRGDFASRTQWTLTVLLLVGWLGFAFAAREQATDQRSQSPPGTEDWLGDILISLPRARRQARDAGHPVNDEVRLLAVHGFLHLLGYDHAQPAEEASMTALTNRILTAAP